LNIRYGRLGEILRIQYVTSNTHLALAVVPQLQRAESKIAECTVQY